MTPAALAKVREYADKQAAACSKALKPHKAPEGLIFRKREKKPSEHHKQSGAVEDALLARQNYLLRAKTLRSLGLVGLASLGVGAGARGLMSLGNTSAPPARPLPAPILLPILHPTAQQREEKAAGIIGDLMGGRMATHELGIPWYLPAAVTVGGGGLLAGWHGVDNMLAARRKSQLQGEVDQARKDFEQAMLGQYEKPKMAADDRPLPQHIPGGRGAGKSLDAFDPRELAAGAKVEMEHTTDPAIAREIATDHLTEMPDYYDRLKKMESQGAAKESADLLTQALDELAEAAEKRSWSMADTLGAAPGMYATYALLTGAPAAYLGYRLAKRRQNASILAKAQRERTRQLYNQQPAPLYARLSPAS